MADHETFLAQILAAPDDDGPRGAFADWLQEQPTPAYADWGRFIAAGLVAQQGRHATGAIDDPAYWEALRSIDELAPALVGGLLGSLGLDPAAGWMWDHTCDRITVTRRARPGSRPPPLVVVFARGFLSELRLTLADWTRFAPEVVSRCPLERVEILDIPGLMLSMSRRDNGVWELRADLTLPVRRQAGQRRSRLREPVATVTRAWSPTGGTRAALVAGLWHAIPDLVERVRHEAGGHWPGAAGTADLAAPGERGEEELNESPSDEGGR